MERLLDWLDQGATVITASGRQARHWRWQYDRRRERGGRGGWPAARILSLSHWLDEAWELAAVRGLQGGKRWPLNDAHTRLLWRQLTRDRVAELTNPGRSLVLLARARALLADWNIPVPALAEAAVSPDEALFATLAAEYLQRCDALGAVDLPGLAYELEADLAAGRLDLPERIVLTGFGPWTRRLERLAQALRTGGCEVRSYAPERPAGISASLFPVDTDEIDAIVHWAARKLSCAPEAGPWPVIGVVLPAMREAGPELRRRVLDIVAPDWRSRPAEALPVAAADRRSLDRLGPIDTALLALELTTGRMDYRDFGGLLRSRFLKGSEEEADRRAQLDLCLRDEHQPQLDLWSLQGLVRERAPVFGSLLAWALDIGRRPPAPQSAGAWIEWLNAYLGEFGWLAAGSGESDDAAVRQAWESLLDLMAGAGAITGRLTLEGLRANLASLAGETVFRPEQRADGLQLLSPDEALGHAFDALWIGGLHTDAWPPAQTPDALVPLTLQRRAGVPESTASGQSEAAARLLDRLTQAASEVVLSSARSSGELRLTPSPVLDGLSEARDKKKKPSSIRERLMWSADVEVLEHDPPPPLRAGEATRGGSRLLQLEASCPARAFFELRLGAGEIATPELGIGPRARGIVAHRALELLYATIARDGLAPGSDAARALVTGVVAAALEERLPARDRLITAVLDIESARLRRLLLELLELEARRPTFRVLAAEQNQQVSLGPVNLRLKLDRIDALADGRRLVIDYKTGAKFSPGAWLGERPEEPQLPLYAISQPVDGIAVIQVNVDGVKVIGRTEDPEDLPGFSSVEKWTDGEFTRWKDVVGHWRRVLDALALEFAAGSCVIDANDPKGPNNPQRAGGQFAGLTRVFELGAADGEDAA